MKCEVTFLTRGMVTGCALLAVAVTAGVHLALGRRTILSVGIGTAVHVVLVNTL